MQPDLTPYETKALSNYSNCGLWEKWKGWWMLIVRNERQAQRIKVDVISRDEVLFTSSRVVVLPSAPTGGGGGGYTVGRSPATSAMLDIAWRWARCVSL